MKLLVTLFGILIIASLSIGSCTYDGHMTSRMETGTVAEIMAKEINTSRTEVDKLTSQVDSLQKGWEASELYWKNELQRQKKLAYEKGRNVEKKIARDSLKHQEEHFEKEKKELIEHSNARIAKRDRLNNSLKADIRQLRSENEAYRQREQAWWRSLRSSLRTTMLLLLGLAVVLGLILGRRQRLAY